MIEVKINEPLELETVPACDAVPGRMYRYGDHIIVWNDWMECFFVLNDLSDVYTTLHKTTTLIEELPPGFSITLTQGY